MRDVVRFGTFRIAEHFVGSKHVGGIHKFWPVEGRERERPKLPTPAEIQEIINRHTGKK